MIAWTSSLAVGIPEIDAQHQAIIRLITTLEERKDHNEAQLATETLRFLRTYLHEHFDLENKLMLDVGYPELDSHREEHERFVNHVIFFEIEKEFGLLTTQILDEILAFLNDWFVQHILTADKNLAVFIQAQAQSG